MVACLQCDKPIAGAPIVRRQFPFCSPACEGAFVARHPIAPVQQGTPALWRDEAIARLTDGLVELEIAATAHDALGVDLARDALDRVDALVLEMLPYLYALGRAADAEELERLDLAPIRDGLPATRAQIAGIADAMRAMQARLDG